MEVVIKSTPSFHPIQLNVLRFYIGGVFLLPFAHTQLKHQDYRLTFKDYRDFAFLGVSCVVIAMSLYTISLLFISAHQDAILFSCNTFFGLMLSAIFLHDKVTGFGKLGLAIAFSGMMIIVNPFHIEGKPIGVILVLLSAFTFGIYSVFSKYLTGGKPTSGVVVTCYAFLFGATVLLALIALTHLSSVANTLDAHGLSTLARIPVWSGINLQDLPGFFYIAVFVTGIGFAAYFKAIELLGVSMTTLVFFIKPVISPFFAYVGLHEIITTANIFGVFIIFIGSMMLFVSKLWQR